MDREEQPETSFFLRVITVLAVVIIFAVLMQMASSILWQEEPGNGGPRPQVTAPFQ